jgi:predicted GH43/DUF377 family glycosyl hydrolase
VKPSLFSQVEATPVSARGLLPSPRHWNCGLLRYRGRLWLTYRFHRMDAEGRCGTAIVELDEKFEPMGRSQHLKFHGATGTEHFEDARLFMFRGKPHISYTMMQGYRPGVDYTCVMKYAELKLCKNGRWQVVSEWQPRHGQNNGIGKEKNWMFFEHKEELHCVYSGSPEHVILRVDGEKIVGEHRSPGPQWHWGVVRGGTPPVLIGDRYLAIFHSSLPTEIAPHFVRYYGAAYTFEAKPPFRPLEISEFPIMTGSEADGHRVDPRYVEGWKPYVVFPCGLVEDDGGWLVSLGINDWQSAVARVTNQQLMLGAADGSSFKPQHFRVQNGSMPVKFTDQSGAQQFLHWEMFKPGRHGMPGVGFMRVGSPREAMEVAEHPGTERIDSSTYEMARRLRGRA